jgi:gliding motility-associated-like protein
MPNWITVYPKPILDYTLNPLTTYFFNHKINVQDRSSELVHEFNFGDGNIYSDSMVTHVYEQPGKYIFNYLVTSEFGCATVDQKEIWIKADFLFFAPTSFTPNADGLNDGFYIHVNGVKKYEINIYNRWGEIVFRSNNATSTWDGKHKGSNAPIGLYTWRVGIETIDGLYERRVGKVNLTR